VLLAPFVLPRALDREPSAATINWNAAAAAGCWMLVLAAFEWYPFQIVRDPALIRRSLASFLEVPFAGFYWSDPLAALEDAVTKVLMAVPLGVFTYFTWARATSRRALFRPALVASLPFFVFFACLEVGQASIAGRHSSITDALLLTVGAGGGCAFAATWSRPDRVRKATQPR